MTEPVTTLSSHAPAPIPVVRPRPVLDRWLRDRDLDDAAGAALFRCSKQMVNRMRHPFDDPETRRAAQQAAEVGLVGGGLLQSIPVLGPALKGYGRLAAGQVNRAMMGEGGLLGPITPQPMYVVPPGKKMPSPYPQQQALELAQQRAAKVDQSLESYPRSLQQGYEHDWYHGSTGDIKNFNQSLLGEATGAASAKKGFFFARDPQNPPASMLQKSTNQESIEMLKKMGMSDDEITKLNTVSMAGHGPETASGYAQIGGSREYRDAMRKANSAEKRGDWGEYEKQMQIAEDSEINRMNYAQSMVAKYGDARDEMLETIKNTIYNKKLSQEEANALDKKYMELMPYGWYNSFEPKQFNQGSFLLASLVPTTYERVSTMGTATLWEIQMRAWSYKHKLAIPKKNEKTEFVGGLSRLLKVGFSTDVLKLDFSSLYPSIQLVHDVFPTCDITGAMKGMLNYFRNTRIKYKNLAKEYQDIDKKQATSYDRKQLDEGLEPGLLMTVQLL